MAIELRKSRSHFWSIALLAIVGTTSVFTLLEHSVNAQQINCDRSQPPTIRRKPDLATLCKIL